jgi:prepilin-type N-terminal cleavage/methylation domain-containing protein
LNPTRRSNQKRMRRVNPRVRKGFTPLESLIGGFSPNGANTELKATRELSRRQAEKLLTGFTLIEVVVAMTILGFSLLIIFGAFRLGLSAWERGARTREDFQRERTAVQMISRQVKSMVPYKIKTQKAEGDYLAFEGKENSLKFVSALSLRAHRPEGFVFVIYEFKSGGGEGGRLLVYEQRVVNADFFEEKPREDRGVSLMEGISDVRFEYYREADEEKNKTEGWVEGWDAKEEKELPRALRMTVSYKNGKNEKEEVSMDLLSSISANRFEEVRTAPAGLGRRAIRERLLRRAN